MTGDVELGGLCDQQHLGSGSGGLPRVNPMGHEDGFGRQRCIVEEPRGPTVSVSPRRLAGNEDCGCLANAAARCTSRSVCRRSPHAACPKVCTAQISGSSHSFLLICAPSFLQHAPPLQLLYQSIKVLGFTARSVSAQLGQSRTGLVFVRASLRRASRFLRVGQRMFSRQYDGVSDSCTSVPFSERSRLFSS
jgi:hypothetical protein